MRTPKRRTAKQRKIKQVKLPRHPTENPATEDYPIDGLDEIDGELDEEWRAAAYSRYLLRLWREGKWEPAMGPLPAEAYEVNSDETNSDGLNTERKEEKPMAKEPTAHFNIPTLDETLAARAERDDVRDWLYGTPALRRQWVQAAENGDMETLQRLRPTMRSAVSNGHIDGLDEMTGLSALGAAASEGHLEIVRWLAGQGASIDIGDRDGASPLQLAITLGHDEIARWLLDNGANLNHCDGQGETALHTAAETCNPAMADWLLAAGMSPTAGISQWQPMLRALRYGQLQIVQALSAAGAPIPSRTPSGSTPLHLVAISGDLPTAQWLLAQGFANDLEALDARERTPADLAGEVGNRAMCRYLNWCQFIHR